MKISEKNWIAYRDRLAAINSKAATEMQKFINANGFEDFDKIIDFAYSLTSKYGEAAAELACQMYDSIATAQNAKVNSADPAETASRDNVKSAVNSASHTTNGIPAAVGKLVKQAGADTMLRNAKRDGAEFAWIPSGDSCAFCRMLASQGWQKAGKSTVSRAAHIHSHCRCEYAVRFDGKSQVEGYDPDTYYGEYKNADGTKWQDKVKAMERSDYAKNADVINARKRAEYAARMDKDK